MDNLARIPTSANIPHRDISAIWGNPYIGVLTKWNELPWQRRQNILEDYPDTDRIAGRINEAKQALTLDLAVADYDTKQFIQDFVIVGLSVWAETQFRLPKTLMAPVYATRMERAFAYIQPKYEKIAYKLSDRAGKFYKKAEDFFRKKGAIEAAKKRTIPTAASKIEWHKKMVKSGQWKPCNGEWKGYYEGKAPGNDKTIYRFKPTNEKHEYEVYKESRGKGLHCGVFRTEGKRALEVIEELAKRTFRGKW